MRQSINLFTAVFCKNNLTQLHVSKVTKSVRLYKILFAVLHLQQLQNIYFVLPRSTVAQCISAPERASCEKLQTVFIGLQTVAIVEVPHSHTAISASWYQSTKPIIADCLLCNYNCNYNYMYYYCINMKPFNRTPTTLCISSVCGLELKNRKSYKVHI